MRCKRRRCPHRKEFPGEQGRELVVEVPPAFFDRLRAAPDPHRAALMIHLHGHAARHRLPGRSGSSHGRPRHPRLRGKKQKQKTRKTPDRGYRCRRMRTTLSGNDGGRALLARRGRLGHKPRHERNARPVTHLLRCRSCFGDKEWLLHRSALLSAQNLFGSERIRASTRSRQGRGGRIHRIGRALRRTQDSAGRDRRNRRVCSPPGVEAE